MDRPSDFAVAFRAHVVPRLRDMVIARSISFWTDDGQDFSQLEAEIWGHAWKYGAGHLPDDHRMALRDWLDAFLTEQIEAARMIHEEAEALVRSLLREPSREVIRESVRGFLGAG